MANCRRESLSRIRANEFDQSCDKTVHWAAVGFPRNPIVALLQPLDVWRRTSFAGGGCSLSGQGVRFREPDREQRNARGCARRSKSGVYTNQPAASAIRRECNCDVRQPLSDQRVRSLLRRLRPPFFERSLCAPAPVIRPAQRGGSDFCGRRIPGEYPGYHQVILWGKRPEIPPPTSSSVPADRT